MCLAYCSPHQHWQSSKSNSDTFLKCKNFLRLIFSILIYTIRMLAVLLKSLCIFSIFLVGLRQIVCCFLPVFTLDQAFLYSSSIFCSIGSLMIALAYFSIYLSVMYQEFHFLYFLLFIVFALLYLIAFLAAMSAFLFPFISMCADI